jgi:hypothetical protein
LRAATGFFVKICRRIGRLLGCIDLAARKLSLGDLSTSLFAARTIRNGKRFLTAREKAPPAVTCYNCRPRKSVCTRDGTPHIAAID